MESGPFSRLRQQLLRALSWVFAVELGLSCFLAWYWGLLEASSVAAGAMAVWLPQLWLALQLTQPTARWNPVALGVAKYTMTGALFAVWFSLVPSSGSAPVMLGTIVALIAIPIATARATR